MLQVGMAPPLSSVLIYLPRRVYFYGTHVDVLTTALIYQGISEYQHGVNHSEGCFQLAWVMKMIFFPPSFFSSVRDNSSE